MDGGMGGQLDGGKFGRLDEVDGWTGGRRIG